MPRVDDPRNLSASFTLIKGVIHLPALIEPLAELIIKTVLRLELQRPDLLERILLLVPLDAQVLDGLFVEVLQKLDAERERSLVFLMELSSLLREDVDRVSILDVRAGELLLLFAGREDAEFGDEISIAIGALRVLWHCHHCHGSNEGLGEQERGHTVLLEDSPRVGRNITVFTRFHFLSETREIIEISDESIGETPCAGNVSKLQHLLASNRISSPENRQLTSRMG